MTTITPEDLRQIKGLGPRKAELLTAELAKATDPTEVTEADLARLEGVSEELAKQVVHLVKNGGMPAEAPVDAPARKNRKRTGRKAAVNGNGKRAARRSSGPEPIKLTAGFVRKAARAAIDEGREDEGRAWAVAVADLLDDELVPGDRLA